MKKEKISRPVIGRLPQYYSCVEELYLSNCIRVSSATLSRRLGFTASQIRQDFSCFGVQYRISRFDHIVTSRIVQCYAITYSTG